MIIQFFVERKSELKFIKKLIGALVDEHQVFLVSFDKIDATSLNIAGFRQLKTIVDATFFFKLLDCDWLLTTQPGLGHSYFKRSLFPKVRYGHIPHSLISLHSGYKLGSFDQFDAIFTCGPHHFEEARCLEAKGGLRKKDLVPYGYEPLSDLQNQKGSISAPKGVLIAPSWNGPLADFSMLFELFESFERSGTNFVFRPHDLLWSSMSEEKKRKIKKMSRLSLSVGNDQMSDLLQASVMICDFSGIAFEFGLGLRRPVFFLDAGQKGDSPYEGVESRWRSLVGTLVERKSLSEIPNIIRKEREFPGEVDAGDFVYDCDFLRSGVIDYLMGARCF